MPAMNMKNILLTVVLCLSPAAFFAQSIPDVIYTGKDSAEVVSLLQEDCGEDVLFYARKFIGRPYVAATLEQHDCEKLVVNLQELDCTTLVETVCALTMTKRQHSDKFADYCRNLERLRYWQGKREGYCSRLHYFAWWMKDNIERGNVELVEDTAWCNRAMVVNDYYMSKYPERYKFLKGRPERIEIIRQLERKYNRAEGCYLGEENTEFVRDSLSFIQNGDIIAIVTTKVGLDYSHLGFAVWGTDGRLHLLNASMIYHKVVEDKNTLKDYLGRIKSSVGIRLLRLK